MSGARLIRDLERQVGRHQVLTRAADLAAYSFDAFGASGERHVPDAVVFPASTDEVSGAVQVCAHHRVPVVPRGAGTGYAGGAIPLGGGVVVNLCRMSRMLGVEREAMRMKVEAGVVTARAHHAAAAAGLYYPPDPGSSTTSTIGGNVACNAGGPHALRYGVTADHVAGATAVLADGRIVRLGEGGDGGTDLLRLLVGSEGTLGVVTEVILRVIPAPAARSTIAAAFADMDAAARAVAGIAAAKLVPAALEFLDEAALDAVRRSGVTAYAPRAGALLLVEVEGDASTAAAESDAVRAAIDSAGPIAVETAGDAAAAHRLWAARKAISAAVARVMIGKVNEDVVVPRDRCAELVAAVRRIGEERQVPVVNFGHLGDGNIHATFLIDPRRPGDRARADAAAGSLFEVVLGMGGSLTGEHGIGYTKLAFVERQLGDGSIALMRRLKVALDPQGILNPGKKIPPVKPA
ncbi:MAG TPA: FAD-linked oxidase C-terminal domain-containing protein [Candidatus Dormibacteraeota bacterium]|jgi:glycolate oxidase subunit GlcD|nr:FAD-linked oxidase C-terminal domain-containing protein [Candidatus Dormibacteraeota bacterium]